MNNGKLTRTAMILVVAIGVAVCGCQPKEEPAPPTVRPPIAKPTRTEVSAMQLSSPAFADGQTIPAKYTADGQDISPPLKWSDIPAGTRQLALIMDDPDAPAGTFTHWLLWGLPADLTELAEGVEKAPTVAGLAGAKQGTNDFGRIGYGGPAPPPGPPHHYNFTIYALDTVLDLQPGARRGELLRAIEGHVLATGKLTGLYGR